ncbi:hypothetical protein [Ktedonospora formicarum]|nr:hypothetical protein [Ktedonospora formicarum]
MTSASEFKRCEDIHPLFTQRGKVATDPTKGLHPKQAASAA